jgi:non-canonical (house-cleaning) NTP pyrophosphatase
MPPMLVVLGSKRGPKLRALQGVLRELEPALGPAEVRTVEAPSGVRETPLDRQEIMLGAWNRARSARADWPDADLWVGMEGGLHVEASGFGLQASGSGLATSAPGARGPKPEACAWLENWACVSNRDRVYFGCGGSIPLPQAIIREVVEGGRSLADVIDELTGKQDVRSGQGTWGILTGGRLTRQEVFRRALLNAFAPFYSPVRF